MNTFIPLSAPNFEGNEEQYVLDAVHQGWVSTGGAYINQFEENLASYTNSPMVVACQSGTAGIHLALIEAGVTLDDYVFVPTLTFIAAVNPIKYQFAHPIFMDCDDSLCLDPIKLKDFCETQCEVRENTLYYKENQRPIKALIVVHVFGNLADMEAIMHLAAQFHFTVIEDATEALGSTYETGTYKGRMAGTIGDYGVYSFNGNKIITTGGGGAITSLYPQRLKHIHYLSTQAKDDPLFYQHNEVGYNYRMTNLQAALGVAQLESLPTFIKRKQENFTHYSTLLEHVNTCHLLSFREGTNPNYWFYSLLIDTTLVSKSIRQIVTDLQKNGIQTRPIWCLIHKQKPYQDALTHKIEKAPYYYERILNIPCSSNLAKSDVAHVVQTLEKIL